jgi:D-3-phosphoglycerate dehydrogenase
MHDVCARPGIRQSLKAPLVHVKQAALDVFSKEPPAADNPLIGREDVVCTPHLGASTTEAQEGVAVEIAEAVVSALKARNICAMCRSGSFVLSHC